MVDSNSPLPQVIQETTGSQTTSYLLGLDLIAQDNGTNREYLLADALGSTRNLTDNIGASVKEINYDVFGAIRSQSGTGSTTFKFTGEQTDDESGIVFLRARYYDPEIGRFISKDPHPGYADVTQSLNLYIYVQNNPINFIDPSGLDKEGAEKIRSAINLLKNSKSAADIVPVLERLNKENKIVFGEMRQTKRAIGEYQPSLWNEKIVVNQQYRNEDIEFIAINLVHEGVHAKNWFRDGFRNTLRRELPAFEKASEVAIEINYTDHPLRSKSINAHKEGRLKEYIIETYQLRWYQRW